MKKLFTLLTVFILCNVGEMISQTMTPKGDLKIPENRRKTPKMDFDDYDASNIYPDNQCNFWLEDGMYVGASDDGDGFTAQFVLNANLDANGLPYAGYYKVNTQYPGVGEAYYSYSYFHVDGYGDFSCKNGTFIRVVKRSGNKMYMEFDGLTSYNYSFYVLMGDEIVNNTGNEYNVYETTTKTANNVNTFFVPNATEDGYQARVSIASTNLGSFSGSQFNLYNSSTWLKKDGELIEINYVSGNVYASNNLAKFKVDMTSVAGDVYHVTNEELTSVNVVTNPVLTDNTGNNVPYFQIDGRSSNYTVRLKLNTNNIVGHHARSTIDLSNSYLINSSDYQIGIANGSALVTANNDGTYHVVANVEGVTGGFYVIKGDFAIPSTSSGTITTSVSPSGAGYITGIVGEETFEDGTYDGGTSISLTAHNNTGWRFDKWSNNATANPYTFTVSKDSSLTAQFIKTYVITVNDDGKGTASGGDTYDVNEIAQLNATSNNEHLYLFQKWQILNGETYEDFVGNTANPINVTVSADATYKAVFRQASNGTIVGIADHGTVTGGGNYNGGDAVELEVIADEGWYFSQWSDGNTDNPRTVYVDGPAEYTAELVEGVEIVDANGTYNVQGNYFEISGTADGYSVLFSSFGVSTLQTGSYSSSQIWQSGTYVQYNGGEKITFTNRQATISRVGIMTWRLDATLSNATGPVYHLVIDVQKTLNGDYSSNINHTFTEGIDVYVDDTDDNIWWITTSGTWETVGLEGWWSDFAVYIDKTKQCGSNGIPSGIYTVAYQPSAGNVVPTISYSTDAYRSDPTYDGTICGYYNNGYYNYFFPVSGTIEIINNNGSYYFNANLRNSRNKTLTESYGSRPSSYTVTVASNNNDLGSVQISTCGTGAVPNQTNKYYENTTLSLTAVPSGDNLFDHWELDGEEVEGEDETYNYTVTSSNAEIVAVFKKNAVYHTVTFKDYDGTTELQTGNVEEGTQPTYNGETDPTRADDVANNTAYTFIGWKSSVDNNVYATDNLPVATAAVTYTAQYEPYFLLLDDKTDNNDAYYTALANKEGERLNVKYMRTFTAGRWATFSLPFGYSYRPEENTTFKGQVYYLISAKYTADGYLTLNCMPVTDGLMANKPYILIPSATIENPTFKNVKMKAVAPNYYTAPNTEGIGTGVEFRNTTERETLARDKRVIYIKGANNQLYYPSMSVDTWMRPFRGYFYLNVTPEQIQYTPARVRLVTPEGEYIEQVPDTEEAATVETKKYIENGILIIERAGMKYDAQGHVIK